MSLRDNVHRLTCEHLTTGHDGKPTMRDALFAELKAAVQPSPGGAGGAGKSLAQIPINPDAVDLMQNIQHEAAADHYEIRGYRYQGKTADLLRTYVDNDDIPADWIGYLDHVTLGWCDRIEALIRPRKPRRKLNNTACPSCGQRFHGPERATCLTADCWGPNEELLKPAAWHVQCEGCGAEWAGNNIEWLLKALHTEAA